MRCAVFGCKNTRKKVNDGNSELNFYLFPKKDPNLCEKWVEFCRRPESFYVKSARICGDHFHAKDKERNLKYELGFEKAYCPKLRPGALPCIYKETKEIVNLKKKKKLSSFPTVAIEAEHSQQFVCDTEKFKNYDKNPLILEEEKNRLNIPIVNLNGQQKAVVNSLNKETANPQTPFKGILAVVYPVDEAGKPLQSSLEQNLRNQVVNGVPIHSKMLANEDLLREIKELKKENNKLKKSEEMFKITIKELENKVTKSNYERDNLEEKLKTIFTSNQIRHMKTGKRVIWSVDDMAKAVKLYKTSSAAYRLLKNQNYPFPSQKTVQVWIQMSRQEINKSETLDEQQQNNATEDIEKNPRMDSNFRKEIYESETLVEQQQNNATEVIEKNLRLDSSFRKEIYESETPYEQQQNNATECIDPYFVHQKPTVRENYNDHIIIEEEQIIELLTLNTSTNNKPEEYSLCLKQDAIKRKNCGILSVIDDHSYFLVAD